MHPIIYNWFFPQRKCVWKWNAVWVQNDIKGRKMYKYVQKSYRKGKIYSSCWKRSYRIPTLFLLGSLRSSVQFTVSSVNLDFISGQIDWSQTLIEIMYCTVLFLRRNVFHFIFRVETSPSHAAIISVVIKSNFCVELELELELCDFFYSLRRQLEKRPLPLKSLHSY